MLSDYFIQRLSENLPYVPTEEQADLIARLSAFLWDDNVPSVFLLKGYAGTGKTSLIGALVKTLESFEILAYCWLLPAGRQRFSLRMPVMRLIRYTRRYTVSGLLRAILRAFSWRIMHIRIRFSSWTRRR